MREISATTGNIKPHPCGYLMNPVTPIGANAGLKLIARTGNEYQDQDQ